MDTNFDSYWLYDGAGDNYIFTDTLLLIFKQNTLRRKEMMVETWHFISIFKKIPNSKNFFRILILLGFIAPEKTKVLFFKI